jgi:uncharacterized protein YndB with AHSA1/START domain
MADILHAFPVNAPVEKTFEIISTAEGIDKWWSKKAAGTPALDGVYRLSFGAGYDWTAVVTKYVENEVFELRFTEADDDWLNTVTGFLLNKKGSMTEVSFYHKGWQQVNEHYRITSYCWAMYLRLLKRYLEYNEEVDYEKRLDV